MSTPLVSVLVLSFNRPRQLARCLDSLAAQTLERHRYEVVLVDVSQPANHGLVRARAQQLVLRHLVLPNRGVAVNRNAGAAAATAPLLAFLDDDCVARPEWLEGLLEAATAHPGALVGGDVVNLNPDNLVADVGQLIHEAVDRHFNPAAAPARFVPGLNFAVPRQGFLSLGGNDEGYGRLGAEDREFCRRWRAAGGRIVKAADAVVAHDHRSEVGGFLRQSYGYGRGAWRYHAHGGGGGGGSAGQREEPLAGSHLALLGQLMQGLAKRPARQRLGLALLLLGWVLAYTAGFLREAGGTVLAWRWRR